MLPCLVLGGGRGSRLGALTETIPKPLVTVAGAPFVRHQLTWLVDAGVTDITYSIGYLGHLIRQELEPWTVPGCSLRFVDEGADLLGTGGAVRLAVDQDAVGDPFLLLYGDSYLQIDVRSVVDEFERSGAEAMMTVFADPEHPTHNNAAYRSGRVVRYDKSEPHPLEAGMHHIDYGLSVLRHATVQRLIPSDRPSDLADLFRTLSRDGRLAGFEAEHRYHEVGSHAGIAALERHLTGTAP